MQKDDDQRNKSAEQRLLSKLKVDEDFGCWLYDGATTSNGYGHIWYRKGNEYAHRLSAVFYLDFDLASGLRVLHRCDVPPCFNPDHLFVGTQRDNMRDASAKGRLGGKKLTPAQVGVIKYRLGLGESHRSLALYYGVSTTAVGQIARGETWKTVEPLRPDDDADHQS